MTSSVPTRRAVGSVVTIGETMALLTAAAGRQLRPGSCLPLGIGGAESNVAIGLARLDVPCTWISRLGDDAFGYLIAREIRAEGVGILARHVVGGRTGMMIKEHRQGRPWRVRYYRTDSAASQMSPSDLDETVIAEAAVLHLTGITAALGPSPLKTMESAIDIAHAAGTVISFDVNYRATLWPPSQAGPQLARFAAAADIVFAGREEAALLLGMDPAPGARLTVTGAELAAGLVALGASTAVIKLGAQGALATSGGQTIIATTRPVMVVDAVGAGDAFVAGYLSEFVRGRSIAACLRMGNTLGGAICQVPGDWEGLPTTDELEDGRNFDDIHR